MTLISTVNVGAGGQAAIEWTGIPQTGKDLLVVMSIAKDGSEGIHSVQFNNDTAYANYNYRMLRGNGSTVVSQAESATNMIYLGYGVPPSIFMSSAFYLPNYTVAINKSLSAEAVDEANATTAYATITAGSWTNTAAITSLKLLVGGTFLQYSSASLYTISTTGATGATVA